MATTLTGRCIYIWKLQPILITEISIANFIAKAKKAKFNSIWIKIAEGKTEYANIIGAMKAKFIEVQQELKNEGIAVWGWHVPFCRTNADAKKEAALVAQICNDLDLAGILMDAESEPTFFKGTPATAATYARQLRSALDTQQKGLAISSHDIPSNFSGFPFDAFAKQATVNAPQVYYGGSSSVENRLDKAMNANSHLSIPFVPVGAGWVGSGGGCSSASACAERAIAFMKLVKKNNFPGYSFWHWQGAPSKLWEVLFSEPI